MNKNKHEALTRLVRAYKDNPDVLKHLQHILSKYLDSTALLAMGVAQETGDPLGKILAESLKQSNNAGLLLDIYEQIPTHSVALTEVNLAVGRRMDDMTKEKLQKPKDNVLIKI